MLENRKVEESPLEVNSKRKWERMEKNRGNIYKVIGFFGFYQKAGVTSISTSIAKILSKDNKVLLIFLSGSKSINYLGEKELKSIDMIKANIISKKCERIDIEKIITKVNDVDAIGDVESSYSDIEYPLFTYEVLSKIFNNYDYIIFDGGADYKNPTLISLITNIRDIYFVGTQSIKDIEAYKDFKINIIDLLNIEHKIILNKYVRDFSLNLKSDIEKDIGEKIDFSIPYIPYGMEKEWENETLLGYKKYEREIEKIAGSIRGIKEPKKKFFKRFI